MKTAIKEIKVDGEQVKTAISVGKEVFLTQGKLILMETDEKTNEGDLIHLISGNTPLTKEGDYAICGVVSESDPCVWKRVIPFIVCTEELYCSNGEFYHEKSNTLKTILQNERSSGYAGYRCTNGDWIYANDYRRRIIMAAEQFTDEQLLYIVKDKMKSGEIVFLECEPDSESPASKELFIVQPIIHRTAFHPITERLYSQDEFESGIQKLMHQVFNADDEIVYSEKMIDFKLSPRKWFDKYIKNSNE